MRRSEHGEWIHMHSRRAVRSRASQGARGGGTHRRSCRGWRRGVRGARSRRRRWGRGRCRNRGRLHSRLSDCRPRAPRWFPVHRRIHQEERAGPHPTQCQQRCKQRLGRYGTRRHIGDRRGPATIRRRRRDSVVSGRLVVHCVVTNARAGPCSGNARAELNPSQRVQHKRKSEGRQSGPQEHRDHPDSPCNNRGTDEA